MASTNKTIDDILRAGNTALGAKVRTQIRIHALAATSNANPALAALGRRALLSPEQYMDRALVLVASNSAIRDAFEAWDENDPSRPTDGGPNDIDTTVTDNQVAAIINEAAFWTMVAERV